MAFSGDLAAAVVGEAQAVRLATDALEPIVEIPETACRRIGGHQPARRVAGHDWLVNRVDQRPPELGRPPSRSGHALSLDLNPGTPHERVIGPDLWDSSAAVSSTHREPGSLPMRLDHVRVGAKT